MGDIVDFLPADVEKRESTMDGWPWGTIITVLIGLATIAVTVYLGLKQLAKTKLNLSAQVDPLLKTGEHLGELSVTWDGNLVEAPAVLRLQITHGGGPHLSSSMFDSGKPLALRIGQHAQVISLNGQNDPNMQFSVSEDRSAILVGPGVMKPGSTLAATALIDGPPQLFWDDGMLLCDTKHGDPTGDRFKRLLIFSGAIVVLNLILIGLTLAAGPEVSRSVDTVLSDALYEYQVEIYLALSFLLIGAYASLLWLYRTVTRKTRQIWL